MKILLIQPPFNPNLIGAGILYLNEPLALETVAASIPHHNVKILDMRLEPNLEQTLNAFQPDIVGVTAYTPDVYIAIQILKKVKEHNENTLTVIGGHHASLLPQDFDKEFIDVIVIGEGQYSFQELVDKYEKENNLKEIDGLALRNNGLLTFNRTRKLIDNLDKTPIPARHLTKQYRNKYFRTSWRPVTSMMTSRGCPYRCNFCSVWKREEGKYRTRSPERVVKELENIEEVYISISDDNFMQDLTRAEKICEMIKERGIKKTYKLIGRSDAIVRQPDIIEKWREIGLKMMFLGLESFRDEDIHNLNKTTSVRNNDKAIHILHENGIKVAGQFIINPDYTKEDFEALAEYVEKMNLVHPIFSVLTPLPGTDLFKEKESQLLTRNYEMFDLVHSVLPTKLPRKEFYKCYAELVRRCYRESDNERTNSTVSKQIMQQLYSLLIEAYRLEIGKVL